MSFGGGFGGFGSNTNNQQSTFGGGGGFGASNNTSTVFGSNSNTGSIFGSNTGSNTGSNMFGGNNASTSSPFGGGGAFGANNNTATTTFGSTPFGAAKTGSNLFGGNAGSTGSFGSGFGGTTANTTSAFGGGNASGGGMFGGAAKPAFGAGTTATTGSTLFGGGNTGGGFGASNTGSGFGASNTAGFQGQQANQGPQPNNGTATTPFNAFTEKDGTSATAQQQYQTITFQDPYKSYSLEELRAVDYNQGRRFGNQNGQAGAFGQSTGFGGFGAGNTTTPSTGFGNTASTGGGLFGNNNAGTTSAFGAGNTTTAFGSSANTSGGGLFGQNKPATGGLFGGAATSQPAATGGLFGGGATANTGAFGSTGGTGFGNTNTAAGGLFGNTNTQAAAKPFNGFGASTAAPAATNPFGGAATNTGGGLFGGGGQTQAASTPFGGGQTQQPAATGGLFGGGGGNAFGGAQQPQAQAQTGGLFGGFGNTQQNQQKPAGGLFGAPAATTTGGGLFGGVAQQPQQTSSLFNNAGTQNNAGGGLFGAKPATTGGLFGSTGNTGGSTGGLFGGAAQNTQQNTGGLFGQSNQQKPAGGLFGGSTASTNTGGGLFGGLGQNNAGGSTMGNSLFSSQNQQQQQQQPMGNSLFGASGNSLLQTSMNTNPYGNDTLFAGLNTPTQSPGPLATPLSSSTKTKKSAILPQSKLNPSASTRLLTPQNRGRPGYGFTYSTYGTPNSASSNGSPVLGGSLFGSGSISRSLGKSMSTSNLRNSFTPETSILAPGAFSTNGRSFASGSLKKLNINRSINNRVPLFDEPSHDKKRVSFAGTGAEERATNGATTNGSASNALVLREEDSPSEGPASFNGGAVNGSNGAPSRSEMEQVNGNAAAAAPQRALGPRTASSLNLRGQNGKVSDPSPGAYWSSPSLQELRQMSQAERRNVRLIVGRDQIGQIEFNMGQPVDLTTVDIEKLYGDIVQLNHRNATVYGQSTTVPKPALGTGLNHPSRITLGNSWPRNRAGKKDQKHLERLKRVGGTTFENYNPATGDWIFTVPHFSTYGLNDSDYSDDEEEEESSELSPVPDTPAQVDTTQMTGTPQDDSFVSPVQSSPDDTFDFKKGNRLRASVPGGFGDEAAYEEDAEMETSMTTGKQSFLGERSVGSLDGQHDDFDYSEEYESGSVEDQDMADSVSGPIQTTEQPLAKEKDSDPFRDSIMPKSILKAGQTLRPAFGTPSKGHLVFDDDWANQLQRTISPRKQDRHALRESQGDALRERDMNASVANFGATLGQSFGATTIPSRMDLMNDLFGETDKGGMAKRAGHGIELPYPKRPKTSNELDQLSDSDKAFHSCNKPHFSESGTLLYANKLGPSTLEDGVFPTVQEPIIGAQKDVRFTKLPTFPDAAPETLNTQKEFTKIYAEKGAPFAKPIVEPAPLDFADVAKAVDIESAAGVHEHQAWQLLSILFDEDNNKLPNDMDQDLLEEHRERYRKDKLSDFWKALVHSDAQQHAEEARTPEEKAIAYLSGYNVADACHALLTGLDLRLATMVAQIGGDHHMRRDMTDQLDEWRRMDVLSEMDESVRALYELLSGNCAASEAKTGGGRENKVNRFTISGRFGLDWRRAFGLRLWYGTLVEEPIELAVAQFADALRDNKDDALPQPWFVEQGVNMGWVDQHTEDREDLLWGILKLYASSKLELPANIEDVLAPENVSGHPLNARLSFQLFQLFKARHDDSQETDERKIGMPTIRDGVQGSFMSSTTSMAERDGQTKAPLTELGDKLTLTYASSLHSPEHWTTAVWVYMHLSSSALREHYIRSMLNLYSHTYSVEESDPTYNYLLNDLRLPHTWLHAAAALQAKTDGDAVREVTHLIQAEEVQEAHEVLRRIVGPDAVITREYKILNDLLQNFFPKATNKEFAMDANISTFISLQMKKLVPAWTQGGGLYFAYISLLEKVSQKSSYRVDKELDGEIESLLKSLQHCLEIVAKERWGDASLEERVALTEIAGTVADLTAQNENLERAKVLRLPLTEDLWLKHTSELSVQYYRAVMTAAR